MVSEYLKGGIGYRELSVRYGIPSRANIRTWVNQARTHGIESLKVKHNKTTYSQTFKITVVEYVHTHQVSRVRAAAHFGISPSQVNSWIRIVKDQGVTGLRAQRKGRPPMGKHKQIKPIKKLEPTQEEKYK
ncbi:Transposase [Lacticaseibacillus paracasei]|nr:Transposase [Lacticaseibacillus paracasei]RND42771.1 Transposase [Lacticaseibacillus paracasei]RND60581.1 Transposase [Lacticaseibacillus paracasei]RND94314.1 Transposase [Lacticaseibacillus paracasei]RND96052.1 Transposase [Lacticaseibacillus paracasei]